MLRETKYGRCRGRIIAGVAGMIALALVGCGGASGSASNATATAARTPSAAVQPATPPAAAADAAFAAWWARKTVRAASGEVLSRQQAWDNYLKTWNDAVASLSRVEGNKALLQDPTFLRDAILASGHLSSVATELNIAVQGDHADTDPELWKKTDLDLAGMFAASETTGNRLIRLYQSGGTSPTYADIYISQARESADADRQRQVAFAQQVTPSCAFACAGYNSLRVPQRIGKVAICRRRH